MLRPYAVEFLRDMEPFFELMAYSDLSNKTLIQIVDKIEYIINKN